MFIVNGVEMTEEEFIAYIQEQNQDDFDYYNFGNTGGFGNGYEDAINGRAYDDSVGKDVMPKLRNNSDYVAGYQEGYVQGYAQGMSEFENNNNGSGGQKVTDHRDFALTSYAGDVYTLNDYYGTPVLMCIWGSWCDACKAKLPVWQELYIESQNYGFEFITVVMPSHFNERDKQDFYDWWETEYVLISLLNDEDARFVQHFEIDRIPVYLIFGSDGTLLYIYDSIPSNEEIITQMQDLIAAGY